MPKIRGVKPDYWTDDAIVELSIPARLLFIGLWNYACDNGHLQDKSKQIKMRLLPGDDVNVAELLRELAERDRIQRVEGYIVIPNFTKHQRPDRRYFQTCDAPGCTRETEVSKPETRSAPRETTTGTRGGLEVGSMGPRVDGDGELMVKGSDGESSAAKKPRRATQLPADFKPTDHHTQLAVSLGVDLMTEVEKFADHHRAKGSTFKDWNSALNNWLRKSAEFRGNVRPLRPQHDPEGRLILPPLPGNEWSGR